VRYLFGRFAQILRVYVVGVVVVAAIKKISASGGETIADAPVKVEAFKLAKGDEGEQAFVDVGAVLLEVAGDLGGHSGADLRDGEDNLALFGIERDIFEEGGRIMDVFCNFFEHRIREAGEEALESLRPEAGMVRDGGEGQEEGAPMGRKGIEGAGEGLPLQEVVEDGGGVERVCSRHGFCDDGIRDSSLLRKLSRNQNDMRRGSGMGQTQPLHDELQADRIYVLL